jgi:hypothetical protein
VPGSSHYEVLGVSREASPEAIRAAYRDLAREHHPDRNATTSSAGQNSEMSAVNEAYRVLGDEERRAAYDSGLHGGSAVGPAAATGAGRSTYVSPSPSMHKRARISWRWVLILASAVVVGGVVLSLFTDTAEPPAPDGVLRVGDCVEIETDLDAREVPCTGDPAVDRVVRVVVDFNAPCPSLTEPHRDQLGMGVACVSIPG